MNTLQQEILIEEKVDDPHFVSFDELYVDKNYIPKESLLRHLSTFEKLTNLTDLSTFSYCRTIKCKF